MQLSAVNIKTPDEKPHLLVQENRSRATSPDNRQNQISVDNKHFLNNLENKPQPPETPPRPIKDNHWQDKSPNRTDQEQLNIISHTANNTSTLKNGYTSAFGGSRENMLAKTDVAMANLLVRLDQVAAQCSTAQMHGGGTLMCEEKFQVIDFFNNNFISVLMLFF